MLLIQTLGKMESSAANAALYAVVSIILVIAGVQKATTPVTPNWTK